MNFFAI